MRRLLIVAPHFPPVSAPDGQRVRMSLPHYEAFGWHPTVLTVAADRQDEVLDPSLREYLPRSVRVVETGALPLALTRRVGIGNVALRAFHAMYRAGLQCIRDESIDLVFISTTMFWAMPLGRLWKARTGVPFVLDMQDPWVNEYLEVNGAARPRKYAGARLLHRRLEPFTMRAVDGVIAVSDAYHETLRRRYPWVAEETCATIPFGVSEDDFHIARARAWRNPFFTSATDIRHVVYLGRGGADMQRAARVFFRAVRRLGADAADRLRIWLVGTDYAGAGRGRPTLQPVAEEEGVGSLVTESPARLPYFDGLRLLAEADVLVLFGSEDRGYSPSKLYPYLLSGRPMIAVLPEESPVAGLARRAGVLLSTFRDAAGIEAPTAGLSEDLRRLIAEPRRPDAGHDRALRPYLARELTRQQCGVFDGVLERRAREAGEPCRE